MFAKREIQNRLFTMLQIEKFEIICTRHNVAKRRTGIAGSVTMLQNREIAIDGRGRVHK